MQAIGSLIRQRREQIGMSASQLAEALGVSKQAVSNWENLPGRAPAREHLLKLARILALPLEELLSRPEPSDDPQEQELLLHFRQLDSAQQHLVLKMLRGATR